MCSAHNKAQKFYGFKSPSSAARSSNNKAQKFYGFKSPSSAARLSQWLNPQLKSDNFKSCDSGTEWGYQDFCLSWSHFTDVN